MKCELERFLVLLFCMKCSSGTTRNLVNDPETNLRAINFGETVVDATLNAGVFSKTRVSTINDCALNCVITWNCISYNFHTITISWEESNCELSDTDRFTAGAYLKHRRGSFHRGIKVRVTHWRVLVRISNFNFSRNNHLSYFLAKGLCVFCDRYTFGEVLPAIFMC